jgi:hypothetical protein
MLNLLTNLIRNLFSIRLARVDQFPMFFPTDRVEWLAKKDLYVAIKIIKYFENAYTEANSIKILEIGVWKGAWSESVLRNSVHSELVGIDPYPGGEFPLNAKKSMLMAMQDLTNLDRFKLQESYVGLCQQFHLVHIDGKHTESNVSNDLDYVSRNLFKDGIIIVDDYRHDYFPGVASAMYKFLSKGDYTLFLVTEGKAYICHQRYHSFYYEYFYEIIYGEKIIDIRKFYSDENSAISGYVQETDVNGYPVLLCLGELR